MDVTVFLIDDGPCPGPIDRLTTPLESGWDRCTCRFEHAPDDDSKWSLCVTAWRKRKGDGKAVSDSYRMLHHDCNGIDDYFAWLEAGVALIEVDGRPFWVNQALSREEMECEEGERL